MFCPAGVVFTIETYQHVLPGMQTDAARVIETLVAGAPPDNPTLRKAG